MKNIEPRIKRQRLVIEARYDIKVSRKVVKDYLLKLTRQLKMHMYIKRPIIMSATGKSKPIHDGYEGVVFWAESGAAIYIWEKLNFMTVDIYSCKKFSNKKAIEFTSRFFNVKDIVYKQV